MTKRQLRAQARIKRARQRKSDNFRRFLLKLADRKREPNPDRPLQQEFCCAPEHLGVSLADFMARGESLVGGAAFLYDVGILHGLWPEWGCGLYDYPHVVTRNYLEENFSPDGTRQQV